MNNFDPKDEIKTVAIYTAMAAIFITILGAIAEVIL